MTIRKKLIEVALPLEAINKEIKKERNIRSGQPSNVHHWWSRKPLTASRAILFASLIDDPSSNPEKFPTEKEQERERNRLFDIIKGLVNLDNLEDEKIFEKARKEIFNNLGGDIPKFLDPFCGGGSIPLEAQRLGLESHASDINTIAVLITKAFVEIPAKFKNHRPVNPEARELLDNDDIWKGLAGLTEDIRFYGEWIRKEAAKRIGYLYPTVKIPGEFSGEHVKVIAWIYARSVKCPNPACGAQMPLASKFWLSSKKGKKIWLEPVIDTVEKTLKFEIKEGEPDTTLSKKISSGTSFISDKGKKVKATFRCVYCKEGVAKGDYIDNEANNGRIDVIPMAIVAEGQRGRVYVPFEQDHLNKATVEAEKFLQDSGFYDSIPSEPARGTFASNAQGRMYGFKTFGDYFLPRQLATLMILSELIKEAYEKVKIEATKSSGDKDYANNYAAAISTYLAFVLDKQADLANKLNRWEPVAQCPRQLFSRQAIPMIWEFAEGNPLGTSSGSWSVALQNLIRSLKAPNLNFERANNGFVNLQDATSIIGEGSYLISTDPPYYDNVSYADLADFFYVWLRRSLKGIYPHLFNTLLLNKRQELVATPYRFENNKEEAKNFFENGLSLAFKQMLKAAHPNYPVTIYYGFKQVDTEVDESDGNDESELVVSSTGWETMLVGLLRAGFMITGTWPLRTEMKSRMVGQGANVLSSSIVLVCRPRDNSATIATRRDFVMALRRELPVALKSLQQGNIAPVDLAQSSIGPGMSIFSRYSKVLESDGSEMTVRTALQIINQELDSYLTAQEGNMDVHTRFCISWYEQFGMKEDDFGQADVLARAKNTSVSRLEENKLLKAEKGKVRLLSRAELDPNWDPSSLRSLSIWECTQYFVKTLETNGEMDVAHLVVKIGSEFSEEAKALAYRLFTIADRKGWTEEALAYNTLVTSWTEIQGKAAYILSKGPSQLSLFE